MDEWTQRIEALERRMNDALGQAEEHHPELLAKDIAARRGKVAAMYERLQLLELKMDRIQILLEGFHWAGPN